VRRAASTGWRLFSAAARAHNTPLPGFVFDEDWLCAITVGVWVYLMFFRG
jgi:hypothetical protein